MLLRDLYPLFLRRYHGVLGGIFFLYAAQAFSDIPATERLQQQAEHGDPQAQLELAKRYANGIKLTRNYTLALDWLTKAATQGDAEAQFYLGWLYTHGKGVPQDDHLAFTWISRAAKQNDAQAQYLLAQFYQHGVGTPLDRRLAHHWYQKACTHRLELACLATNKPTTEALPTKAPLPPSIQEAP